LTRPTAALAAFLLLAAPAVSAADAPTRTTRDGVYTTLQAERGKRVYQRACAECHPLDWYRGEQMKAWDGAPLFGLFELIMNRMPQQNPGSLKRREYAEIVSYLLSLNDQPAGSEELSDQESALTHIVFKGRSKP
jgi:mono/diheme cytochrome c family protein